MMRTGTARFTSLRKLCAVPVLGAALLLVAGCGGANAATRPDMQMIEERRAALVIQEAIHKHGEKPGPGKDATLRSGDVLHVDVTVTGTIYGVAFVTEREAAQLGSSLPPRRESNELRLVRPEGDVVLLLYQDRYQYDRADTHAATAVTAEAELSKDIADFVLRVVQAEKRR
ncbi:MAG: hypothetical protein JRI23_00445 [Deltaproteobacteria bacterium]|jgi:hypothetical protein|nr:hypothetical protein [Deltaproteobacteria bacterium]MBW2529914.1 hypothetical protein [Deltaproteobacteria bacterium]